MNLAWVSFFVALAISIVVPAVLNFIRISRVEKMLLDRDKAVDSQLKGIHDLVNSQLSEAVNRFEHSLTTIEAMKVVLLAIAPDDQRVRDILEKEK